MVRGFDWLFPTFTPALKFPRFMDGQKSAAGTVQLFKDGSGNTMGGCSVSAAARDIFNVTLAIGPFLPPESAHPKAPVNPPVQQSVNAFRYAFPRHTSVSLRASSHLEGDPVGVEGDPVKLSVQELDVNEKRWVRTAQEMPETPSASNHHEIFVKHIYPSGHGYPYACSAPLDQPIRIGDVGVFDSSGFRAIRNLSNCDLPSLQIHSLALSDVSHVPEYFYEGASITGGGIFQSEVCYVPGSKSIQSISYLCQGPEGAALAVTSPAELCELRDHSPLRNWLFKYGIDLFQLLDQDSTQSLYIVTGTIKSSSWATATYCQHMESGKLVLSHIIPNDGSPSVYRWTRHGIAQGRSSASKTAVGGTKENGQYLFLRGFLLTLSSKARCTQDPLALKASKTSLSKLTGGGLGPKPKSDKGRRAAAKRGSGNTSIPRGRKPGLNCVLVESVPSNLPIDFYPLYRINKRLLELTKADLAIVHDDDCRNGKQGICKLVPDNDTNNEHLSVKFHDSTSTNDSDNLTTDEGSADSVPLRDVDPVANPQRWATRPLILLLGETGSGKSTFVNTCIPGAGAPINDGLKSMTKTAQRYDCKQFIVIDTPGFNDSDFDPDHQILQGIIALLDKEFSGNARCSVIFLQSRSNPESRALKLLQKALEKTCHLISTEGEFVHYDGVQFQGRVAATEFCLKKVKYALAGDYKRLSVRELVNILEEVVRKVIPHKPKKRSWWKQLPWWNWLKARFS